MAKKWGDTSNLHDFMAQDVDLKTKATVKAMELVSHGHGTTSAVKWLGRTVGGLETLAASMAVEQNQIVVFTRWTVPDQGGIPWFVDMLETRWLDPDSTRGKMAKVSGNAIVLKHNHPSTKITFKVHDTVAKGLKSQKAWSKKRGVEALCNSLVLVENSGGEVPLMVVARIQRHASIVESREVIKRFEDKWTVPGV